MDPEFDNLPPECEIVTTRILNFPLEKVFNAWSKPDLLKQWWGPAGFTNTFQEFDFTPGGRWKFIMHGPGGKGNYKNECIFHTIEKNKLIIWKRVSQPLFNVVTAFEKITDEETKLIFRMQFNTKGECDKIRGFATGKNEENFDKLEEVLTREN